VVHPSILSLFQLRGPVIVAEWQLEPFFKEVAVPKPLPVIPEYPSVERDWTAPIPRRLPVGRFNDSIQRHRPENLSSWELISVYDPESKSPEISVTWRFSYRNPTRTLTAAEVDAAQADLVKNVLVDLASSSE
jgi:phenylalanyl-tRNA synthetase beta chain